MTPSLKQPAEQSPDEQHVTAKALCAALAFEPFSSCRPFLSCKKQIAASPVHHAHSHTIVRGHLSPQLTQVDSIESLDDEVFFDALEFHDESEVHIAVGHSSSRASSPMAVIRGGASAPVGSLSEARLSLNFDPPPPPQETPLRFIRAGKGDPVVGRQRYEQTLKWRKLHGMDTILKEPAHAFELIKSHYPHYFHLKGRNGETCYYEKPPQTNLKALREGGVNLNCLLRHYAMMTEFHWQVLDRNDFGNSIYIIDLKGIRLTDFVGECVDFVRKASEFTGQHYPERAGFVFVVNVPTWFKVIWSVVKPMVDEVTLKKIYILRGKKEIFNALTERIPVENIPPEYGGTSVPLGQAPEELLLWKFIRHNNAKDCGHSECAGVEGKCQYCTFQYARSY